MQTAPAVCHTPPVPPPPISPPYPEQLELWACRRCTAPACGAYRSANVFSARQVSATPPTYYKFENRWDEEPITCYLRVELLSSDNFTTCQIKVKFLYQYPSPPSQWEWTDLKPLYTHPLYLPWKHQRLYPEWTDHRFRLCITETGLKNFLIE